VAQGTSLSSLELNGATLRCIKKKTGPAFIVSKEENFKKGGGKVPDKAGGVYNFRNPRDKRRREKS